MDQRIGTGLLQNQMNFDIGWENELNNWLNREHILELLHAEGIHGARRFVMVSDPTWGDHATEGMFKWLTHYQLGDENVLESPGYLLHRTHGGTAWTKRILNRYRLARTVYRQSFPTAGYLSPNGVVEPSGGEDARQPIGTALFHIAMNVESHWETEVTNWLTEMFLPDLLKLPGFISARQFRKKPAPSEIPGSERDLKHEGIYEFLTVVELADEAVLQGAAYLDSRANPSATARKLATHYTFSRSIFRQIYPEKGSCENYDGIGQDAFTADADWNAPLVGGL